MRCGTNNLRQYQIFLPGLLAGGIISFLIAAAVLIVCGCNRHFTVIPAGKARLYKIQEPIELSSQSLRVALNQILVSFQDTVEDDRSKLIWESYSNRQGIDDESRERKDIENLNVLFSILRDRQYSIISVSPLTCEALHAISSLPILPCILIIHFEDKHFEPLQQQDLTSDNLHVLSPHAQNSALHIISSTEWGSDVCNIRTLDGLVWSIPLQENILGQIFSENVESGNKKYCQSAASFFITTLSALEIKAHIDEWFERLPDAPVIPSVSTIE